MRIGVRLAGLLALVGVLPLVGLAVAASGASRSWLVSSSVDFQVETVRTLASGIARQLSDTERVLRLHLSNYNIAQVSPEAQQAFLISTYRLFPDITVVFLRDAQGLDILPPIYQSTRGALDVPGHARVSQAHVDAVRAGLPTPSADAIWMAGGVEGGPDTLTLQVPSPWSAEASLAVELALDSVGARIQTVATAEREVVLFALDGRALLRAGELGLVDPSAYRPLLETTAADLRYAHGGGEMLGAVSRVPGHPLAVGMATPLRTVDASSADIRARTGYIAGLTLFGAICFGVLLARAITKPLSLLGEAAGRMGRGDLAARVELQSGDEFGDLARSFNSMARSLEQSRDELASKNVEIEAFNRELQARVERRTAQLRLAQASLVQSRQLAAVAELSAGLTHELNNPLAGVVGLLQVAQARGEDPLLAAAEREALRCTEIVARLARFTQPAPTAPGEVEEVDLHELVDDVLALLAGTLREQRIRVEHAPTSLRVRGEQASLGRALGQLIGAVRTLAVEGSVLRIGVEGANLVIDLHPVRSSQDDWRAAALGFWGARQVLQEHGATVEEPVAGGDSARWTLRFGARHVG